MVWFYYGKSTLTSYKSEEPILEMKLGFMFLGGAQLGWYPKISYTYTKVWHTMFQPKVIKPNPTQPNPTQSHSYGYQ